MLAYLRKIFTTFKTSNKYLKTGSIILLFMLMIIIFEPMIINYLLKGKSYLYTYKPLLPPSFQHILGTDYFGRDWLALQIVGLKYSLMIGLFAGCIATLIAVTIATMAGYAGKWIDALLNSTTNAFLILPSFPILLAIAIYIRTDLIVMCLILSIFAWAGAARSLRAQILSLKEQPYVELAKVSGLRSWEIMFKEILPNLLPYVITGFSWTVIGAIAAETGLRMMGLGPAELMTLGLHIQTMLRYGAFSALRYNLILPPIILLILIFVAFNFINVGIEEWANPRLKKVTGL